MPPRNWNLVVSLREHAHGRMLDVGCGQKPYKAVFEDRVSEHVGVDVPTTGHAKNQIDAYATALALPFRDEQFDFVLCTEVLEHVPDPFLAMSEIARMMKPGASLILTTPFLYRVHEAPYDFFRYTPFAHRELARRTGLEVIKIAPRGGVLSVLFDFNMKFAAAIFGGLNHALAKIIPLRRHILSMAPVRFVFLLPQLLFSALSGAENIKSDTYTIGYVVLLRKTEKATSND